jgi:hypothetical protein
MNLKELQGQYKNKLCFVFGAGPSLHFVNMKPLNNYLCLAVNAGIMKYKEIDFFGFVSDDSAVRHWHYYSNILPTLPCYKFLYKKKLKNYAEGLENVYFFDHTWWFQPKGKKYNLDGLKLTKEEPIIGARLSAGSAVHIAYILGCDPIVLLGTDCMFRDNKRYFWEFEGEEITFRINGDNSFNVNKHMGFQKGQFLEYWNTFAKVNADILGKEVNIIDASDGLLECFPKMSVQKVLEKYGDRIK